MTGEFVWALIAAAPDFDAAAREAVIAEVRQRDLPPGIRLVTCHRVEVYGAGAPPDPDGFPTAGAAGAPLLLAGVDALRHLFRLAAGLESAVLGEEQVLHQVRAALRDAPEALDPTIHRAFQLALRTGRQARIGGGRTDRTLGDLALGWLEGTLGGLRGRRLLVVGTGVMGRALARAAVGRGAAVTIANRRDLAAAARSVIEMDAVAVALRGPWHDLADAPTLPPTVDLSFPPAVPVEVRARTSSPFSDIDMLSGRRREAADERYVTDTERLIHAAESEFQRWLGGRRSVPTLRAMRDAAEKERVRAVERLLRRMPGLADHERELVTAMSRQLVATVFHRPTAALRDDVDGGAAAAAERLFGA